MKLSQAVREYVEYKQALGMRFHTEAVMLQAFCRSVGRGNSSRRYYGRPDLCLSQWSRDR